MPRFSRAYPRIRPLLLVELRFREAERYSGQAAPPPIQVFICASVSGMAILAARRSETFVDFEKGFCRSSRVGLWVVGCSMQIGDGEYDQRNCKDRQYPDQRKVCPGVF